MQFRRLVRSVVPDIPVTLRHVERGTSLTVGLKRHLGMVMRGARAYEPLCVSLVRAAVLRGALVLDVGANVGFFTLLLSRRVGPTGRVVAFEPDPSNLDMLRRNISANGCDNIAVHDVALGDRPGVAAFMRDQMTGLEGHLVTAQSSWEDVSSPSGAVVNTRVSTIDLELEGRDRPVDFVKIDVEGSEAAALAGAEQMLRADRPVILTELSSSFRDVKAGRLDRAASTLLFDLGYLLFDVDTGLAMGPDDTAWMALGIPAQRRSETVMRTLVPLVTEPARIRRIN